MIECHLCERTFVHQPSLSRHIRIKHPHVHEEKMRARAAQSSARCLEDGCSFACYAIADLRAHLIEAHGFELIESNHEFDNMQQFVSWKSDVENASHANFVRYRDKRITNGCQKLCFRCNRTGKPRPSVGLGIRQAPDKGSTCKMGCSCTATIVARHVCDTGAVSVTAYLQHYGHDLDPRHVRVPQKHRDLLLQQLRRGASLDAVAEAAAGDEAPEEPIDGTCEPEHGYTRVQLVNPQFLRNLSRRWAHASPEREQRRHGVPLDLDEPREPSIAVIEDDDDDDDPSYYYDEHATSMLAPTEAEMPSLKPYYEPDCAAQRGGLRSTVVEIKIGAMPPVAPDDQFDQLFDTQPQTSVSSPLFVLPRRRFAPVGRRLPPLPGVRET